ncbi:ABC transporter ATP-binding protein [Rhodoferax sp.]|uniref:ABC transporter ATP-binding protein n=1 Tax=Rhodoferax sp. TaxID=50421 RepID=UPI00274D5E51|nr:ATP-binding cassette domain-containing protein [Rhodoferax sp.]
MARKSMFQRGPSPVLQAVSDVSFSITPGETLALVGESGCGKTTLGRALVGLYAATRGAISFKGENLSSMSEAQRKKTRRAIQMIFQDPYESLNPRLPVSDVITEPLLIHGIGNRSERADRARELIAQVGLPVDALNRYPHQFSGGQRQRIAIARALGPEPELMVADEPLSALDVSIQSQILNLMSELRERRHLSYLFISHDLAAVHHLADRVAVMYLGRLVEVAPRADLYDSPSHPYTRALIEAIPRIGQGRRSRGRTIQGDLPSPLDPPSGCAFHPRCPKAQAICKSEAPTLLPAPGRVQQLVACHFKD